MEVCSSYTRLLIASGYLIHFPLTNPGRVSLPTLESIIEELLQSIFNLFGYPSDNQRVFWPQTLCRSRSSFTRLVQAAFAHSAHPCEAKAKFQTSPMGLSDAAVVLIAIVLAAAASAIGASMYRVATRGNEQDQVVHQMSPEQERYMRQVRQVNFRALDMEAQTSISGSNLPY